MYSDRRKSRRVENDLAFEELLLPSSQNILEKWLEKESTTAGGRPPDLLL